MPFKSLQEVIQIPKFICQKFKQEVTPLNTIFSLIGIKQNSSNFSVALSTVEAYGLLQKESDGYSVSELGRKITAPTYNGEDKEAIRKAVLIPCALLFHQ